MNTVWVVGSSGGLGKAVAEVFMNDGWIVVAGARSYNDKEASAQDAQKNLFRLPLDVTQPESCKSFVHQALTISPQVDVLVVAAAILNLGSCEYTSAEEYNQVMQTNFIGLTRMVSLTLPVMRKQSSGKIFLFSSINGLMGIPFQSAYTASKHAIEGYAECLAMETAPFGIQICLLEPGDHRGGSNHTRLHALAETEDSPYFKRYKQTCAVIHRDESNGLIPKALGKKVLQQAKKKQMRFRLCIASSDQKAVAWLHKILPTRFLSFILMKYYHGL